MMKGKECSSQSTSGSDSEAKSQSDSECEDQGGEASEEDMSKGSQAESLQQKLEEVDEWEKPKTNSADDTPSLSSSRCFGTSD